MEGQNNMGIGGRLLAVVAAVAVMLAVFYGLDHLIMGMQGLPLNPDLSPAG
ncbi:hypothetical protein [Thiolapillus sp.]